MPEVSSIAVVADQDGDLQVLALARAASAGEPFEGQVFQQALDTAEDGISIGRPTPGLWQADTDLAVAGNVDGRLEVVVVGADGALWHAWQRQPGGPWSSWDSLDAPPEHDRQAGSAVLGRNEDGRLELFTVGAGAVWHRWQQRAGQGPWHDWHSLKQPSGSRLLLATPAVAQNHDGRLELFAVDLDGVVWHIWQTAPNSGWSRWERLDNPGVAPRGPLGLALQEDGRLVLLLAAVDGGLWRRSQQKAGAGPWEPWEPLDTPAGGLRLSFGARAVGAHEDGRLILVTIHKPKPPKFPEVWLVEQTAPNGSWAGRSLGQHPIADFSPGLVGIKIASPALASRADGRLVLSFVIWGAKFLYTLDQDHPNGSTWGAGLKNPTIGLTMDEWE
jgi:hypothetical protein